MKFYNYSKNTLRNVLLFSLFSIILFACKKEYTEYPYTDLLQFSVKDTAGATLKAVIKDQDIIVYWPPFQSVPDSVSPVIAVAERAAILPASGKKVPFKDGFTYTITAQNGTVKTYTLKPAINQPVPQISITTTAAIGTAFSIQGDYILPDISKTRIFLISNTGLETPLSNFYSISQISIGVYLPEVPAGKYQLKMINGNHVVLPKDSVAITYNTTPNLENIASKYPVAVKRSQEYIYRITGTPVSKITKLRMRLLATNVFYDVVISARNPDNSVTIKIPDTMPPGAYSAIEISSSLLATPYVRSLSASARIVVSE
jgi:hypothetical protein